jgi:hypothetical protein
MHADNIADRITIAGPAELDAIIKDAWADHTNGLLTESDMECLDELARERRGALQTRRTKTRPNPRPAPSSAPRASARRPRSPDRQASIERRRRECSSGMMPPRIAALFTEGERAALAVIAKEVKLRGGCCDLYIGQIEAFAGVERSTVKNATRKAKQLNLLTIEEWKQAPDWNGPNRIRIVAADWVTWLAHHRAPKMTVKPPTTTHNQYSRPAQFRRVEGPQGYRKKGAAGKQPDVGRASCPLPRSREG